MSFITAGSRHGGLLGLAAAVSLLAIAPAAQAERHAANPDRCVPKSMLVQPFAPWGDFDEYTLSPGGSFENAYNTWMLDDGARIVDGNESFYVGADDDSHSLSLPAGSSAISTPICIDETYPTFRLFARNTGDLDSKLKVEVLYTTNKGKLKSSLAGRYKAVSSQWAPTRAMEINVNFDPDSSGSAAPVAFRFTTVDKRDDDEGETEAGAWQIDDVYVDPRMRH